MADLNESDESDEREKFDHSDHATTHSTPGDLTSHRSGGSERPSQADDSRGGVSQREPVIPPDR